MGRGPVVMVGDGGIRCDEVYDSWMSNETSFLLSFMEISRYFTFVLLVSRYHPTERPRSVSRNC